MGGWFLSFAMANFLAGQIAAVTGAEGNEEKIKDKRETTLVKALAEHPDVGTFNEWNTSYIQMKHRTVFLKTWI